MAEYTLYQGDCLKIMPTLEKGSVQCVFADLPYGCTRNAWDQIIPLRTLWQCFSALCAPHGPVLVTGTQPFSSLVVSSWQKYFRHNWVWHKCNRATGFLNANRRPLNAHEDILVFGRNAVFYNPQKTAAKTNYSQRRNSRGLASSTSYGKHMLKTQSIDLGVRLPQSVLTIKSVYRGVHPTQKPVALLTYLICTYTRPGDVVLDPVMGSGTTGVACANLGRRFVGIEKDPTYFAAAKERIEKAYADAAAGPKQGALAV